MPAVDTKTAEAWTRAKASLSILVISIGISLFTAAYERAVDPLFGSVATTKYFNYVVHASTALGVVLPKPPRSLLLPSVALLVQVAPHTSYWIGVFAARGEDPVLGPLFSHAVVLAPTIYLAVSLASSIDSMLATIALAVNALQLRPLVLLVAHQLSLDTHKDVVFLVLGAVASLAWTLNTGLDAFQTSNPASNANGITIRKSLAVSFPAICFLLLALSSPTLSSTGKFPYRSQYYPLVIHSSRDSVTGTVVVGELLAREAGSVDSTTLHSIRYLRVSHSLLGGVWMGSLAVSPDGAPPRTDQVGTPLGDSIYSAFVLQEAARLVNLETQDISERENALIIGLGAGISADAFVRHGVSTTIVEIDPAVYDAARTYFGLADLGNGRVFLEDARNWVYKRRVAMQADENRNLSTFDIVIHDCFSGGGVPQHLFSMEFWGDLKAIMRPDGVVAVNFAGELGSQSTRAVLTTLLKVFKQCRAFHDLPNPVLEDSYSDFLNIVFFCSPSSRPLVFRPAVDADYLYSYLRRNILSSLDQREISLSRLKGGDTWFTYTEDEFVLTDMNNTLDSWQTEEALRHWKLMRKILPDVVWETY